MARSPESDVSPQTQGTSKIDYFSMKAEVSGPASILHEVCSKDAGDGVPAFGLPSIASSTICTETRVYHPSTRQTGGNSDESRGTISRKCSTALVAFRPPRNPSLPQGIPRKPEKGRMRSPDPVKFRNHVGFDNLPLSDVSKHNTTSLTLSVRHEGYHPTRRSRTFMVGLDEHAYSDYALVWLLTNMVDDGDEVICVRVVENPIRSGDNYQDDAKRLMNSIQEKNELNRAISIILEYSVGKLHATFQQLIQMHQPSMLIVGTKGRSLGGLQGLVNTRNSFSKYCLQYSLVPVVVVRPDDKRKKKKEKRTHNPTRQSYAAMLAHNDGKHEADSEASSVYELERGLSPAEEAHQVAAAIGLPAAFDPTIKPYEHRPTLRQADQSPLASPPLATSEMDPLTSPRHPRAATESGDEESGDEEEDEDENDAVTAEHRAEPKPKRKEDDAEHAKKKKRLHAMEVGEAAALLKSGASDVHDEDEDEDDAHDKARKAAEA